MSEMIGMASEEMYARGAGAGEQEETGGVTNMREEISEDEIKEIAREDGASWQIPPSGLYIYTIFRISEKIEAETKEGKKYTYRQVLGWAHGRSGNLTYDGEVLLKVVGTQAEIFKRIADSDTRKCLIDIRKWNGMPRINGVYGVDYLIQLLSEAPGHTAEVKELKEAIGNASA